MRISDWSSDVCSSDLPIVIRPAMLEPGSHRRDALRYVAPPRQRVEYTGQPAHAVFRTSFDRGDTVCAAAALSSTRPYTASYWRAVSGSEKARLMRGRAL